MDSGMNMGVRRAEPNQGVAQRHPDYQARVDDLVLVDDLRQGTRRLREQHDKYLPRFAKEKIQNYERRWGQATLHEAFEQTVGVLCGKAFTKPPQLDDDVPEEIRGVEPTKENPQAAEKNGLAENIDLRGNHFQIFAANLFRKALRSGAAHILVDSTPMPQGAVTEADKLAAGHRPYWALYDAMQVIGWATEVRAGVRVLTQVRIMETVQVKDGDFGVSQVEQVRVLEPGRFRIFRKDDQDQWDELPEGAEGGGGPMVGYDGKPLDYIPLVSFLADDSDSPMLCKPPLLDLAYRNVEHFQAYSEYRNGMTVACFPILAASGYKKDEDDELAVGPMTLLVMSDPAGKFYFVEHSGAALGTARTYLEDLKSDMANYGMKMLVGRQVGANPTATGEAITEAASTSELQEMVLRLKDALELALDYTARWLGKGDDMGGSVKVDVNNLAFNLQDVDNILKAAGAPQKPVIDAQTAIEELQKRGFLDENADPKEILARLQSQATAASPLGQVAGSFLRPTGPQPGNSNQAVQ